MAKKKNNSAPEPEEVEEEEEELEEEEEEMVYLQVDTGDIIKLKQILDETVASTFIEESVLEGLDSDSRGKNIGLREDHTWNNVKLSIMTVACAFAMVAQFAPLPFPESRIVLGGCCAAYFVLSGVLQLITTFWDKDCILITDVVAKEGGDVGSASFVTEGILKKNPDLRKYGLRIRTNLPRFSEFYSVIIEFEGYEKENQGKKSPFVEKTWSVGKFFDVEGMFDEYGMEDEVEQLYTRFINGKFDAPDDAKVKKE